MWNVIYGSSTSLFVDTRAVPKGHKQDQCLIVLGTVRHMVRDSPCPEMLTISIGKVEKGERKDVLSPPLHSCASLRSKFSKGTRVFGCLGFECPHWEQIKGHVLQRVLKLLPSGNPAPLTCFKLGTQNYEALLTQGHPESLWQNQRLNESQSRDLTERADFPPT